MSEALKCDWVVTPSETQTCGGLRISGLSCNPEIRIPSPFFAHLQIFFCGLSFILQDISFEVLNYYRITCVLLPLSALFRVFLRFSENMHCIADTVTNT